MYGVPILGTGDMSTMAFGKKTVNLKKNGNIATISIEQAQKNNCKVSVQHVIGLFLWF